MTTLDLEISSNWPVYSFNYSWNSQFFSHKITVPVDCAPSEDSLFRVALLSRPINSDFVKVKGVTPYIATKKFFEKHTKSVIEVDSVVNGEGGCAIKELGGQKVNLAFSGGFDSISALAIIGEDNVNLMSNDFGGAFKRESDFFRYFNPSIFTWELRGLRTEQVIRFNESVDWRFMISTPLLYQSGSEVLFVGTGTILESGPFWYSGAARSEFKSYSSYGLGPNVATVNPVACLSEYLTTKIAIKFLGNEMIERSLDSLASTGSFKRYRKEVLMSLVRGEPVPSVNPSVKLHRYGKGYGDDIIAMYLVWKLGLNWVLKNYCPDIPTSSKYLDMSFFEKFNSGNLMVFDSLFRDNLINSFKNFGINGYDGYDSGRIEVSKMFREEMLGKR